MNIHFEEPPPAKRLGGLDAAIRSLEAAVRNRGFNVTTGTAHTATRGDVVHFHGLWQPSHSKLSRILSKRGVSIVISPHGMLEPWAWRHRWWKKWPYYLLIERSHLRRATMLLATASPEAKRLQAMLPNQQVRSLPLGLTDESAVPDFEGARAKLGWDRDESVILFLSRLHEKKGLDLLIRALAQLNVPERSRLVIVGGGEPRYIGKLRALADRLKDKLPRVDWIGEVWGPARWPYFQGADLFCLPTHSENFGLAVMEACQVGTPALTTTTTPWAEWLNGGRGFIAEPTVESVAHQLRQYLAQAGAPLTSRQALAQWTRDEFSWNTLAPRFEDFYRSLA